MRLLWAILIAASFALAGCTSAGKKPSGLGSTTGRDAGRGGAPFWADRDNTPPFSPNNRNGDRLAPDSAGDAEGILAGRVIDEFGRSPPNVFIQVAPVGQAGAPSKPIGVSADAQGYFLVPGLKAGRTYMLSIRAEDGNRVLASAVQERVPNTRLLIRVREGNVSTLTPPAQPHPGEVGPFAQPDNGAPKAAEAPATSVPPPPDPIGDAGNSDQSWRPGAAPPASRGNYAPPPTPSRYNTNPPRLENIAEDPSRPRDPKVNIPNPSGPPRPAPPRPVTVPDTSLGPTPNGTRANFTLYDPERGDDWEFRYAQGRLILLDFWKTNCGPCIRAMPEVKRLAGLYGASGLEVIGVACEDPAPRVEQASAVSQLARRQELNYRVLLDSERGDVQRRFGVQRYPTMLLLDRQGNVVWRGVGAMRENFDQLEETLKRGLTRR
jgi:thiol-disulfide isomerase/thioredoxin